MLSLSEVLLCQLNEMNLTIDDTLNYFNRDIQHENEARMNRTNNICTNTLHINIFLNILIYKNMERIFRYTCHVTFNRRLELRSKIRRQSNRY